MEQEKDRLPYRTATDGEKTSLGYRTDHELLVGPDGFTCLLGEPEDRTWKRDASDAVDELNRLHRQLRDGDGTEDEPFPATPSESDIRHMRMAIISDGFRTAEERIACIAWVVRQLPSVSYAEEAEWTDFLYDTRKTSDFRVATAAAKLLEAYLRGSGR